MSVVDDMPTATGGVEYAGRDFFLADVGRVFAISHVDFGGAIVLSTGAAVSAHNGVALPLVGEFVTVPGEGGVVGGYWMGLAQLGGPGQGSDQCPDRVRVLLLAAERVVEHDCEASAVAAERVVVGRAEPGTAEALRALRAAREQAAVERQGHERWKADFGASACDRADSLGLCSQFDDFMEDWGLASRTRTWDVEVEVTARVYVSIEGRSVEDAESSVDRGSVEAALLAAGLAGLHDLDYEVR